jgi:hypothetical protein
MSNQIREATWEERATWGECPVCKAQPGEYCLSDVGFQVGRKANSRRMRPGEGAHLGRLRLAPFHVKLVAV